MTDKKVRILDDNILKDKSKKRKKKRKGRRNTVNGVDSNDNIKPSKAKDNKHKKTKSYHHNKNKKSKNKINNFDMISIEYSSPPSLHKKRPVNWTVYEVCCWLASIDDGQYQKFCRKFTL